MPLARIRPIAVGAWTPLDAARRWPRDEPLALLHSGGVGGPWARWSILARPRGALVVDRRSHWSGPSIPGLEPLKNEPLAALEAALRATRRPEQVPGVPPFTGGWIGWLSYDLFRRIEPVAAGSAPPIDDRGWPDLLLLHCPDALCFDHRDRRWYAVGDIEMPSHDPNEGPLELALGAWRSAPTPDEHLAAVRRAIDYIHEGDVFQVNLTRRLSATLRGNVRAFALAALAAGGARQGAYLEWSAPDGGADRAICSMSPELFLHLDGTSRRITTRPVKGTRPGRRPVDELARSAKDTAELHMIVDLMRSDLGRVCEPGSIEVPAGRVIESHPTVLHGVGEVTGLLREDASMSDLVRATFPPGSVTGAPKIRAMQIIDELETVRRGPYCGAIGFFSDSGDVGLNVAIRTIACSGVLARGSGRFEGVLDYGTGGGIVADSDPLEEYRETETKTAVLHAALRAVESIERIGA